MTFVSLLAVGALLAWANGANDNFKGVATLYGSGVLTYRRALALATVATFLGSLAAIAAGSALVAAFHGKGLVPDAVASDPGFMVAAGSAAAATVLLASRRGLPISTTHALLGGLLGAGLVRAGSVVDGGRLWLGMVAPLLLSPLLASLLAAVQYWLFHRMRRVVGVDLDTCVCLEPAVPALATGTGAAAMSLPALVVDDLTACAARATPGSARVTGRFALNAAHVLSAAAVSFARGVNDTPKIAALMLATELVAPAPGAIAIGLAIAAGGLLGARRVAETMSHRIAVMSEAPAFVGNVTTAMLVLVASPFGLPVSTTHVSCGALFGIGLATGRVEWDGVRRIALAWLFTVPFAAALGAVLAG